MRNTAEAASICRPRGLCIIELLLPTTEHERHWPVQPAGSAVRKACCHSVRYDGTQFMLGDSAHSAGSKDDRSVPGPSHTSSVRLVSWKKIGTRCQSSPRSKPGISLGTTRSVDFHGTLQACRGCRRRADSSRRRRKRPRSPRTTNNPPTTSAPNTRVAHSDDMRRRRQDKTVAKRPSGPAVKTAIRNGYIGLAKRGYTNRTHELFTLPRERGTGHELKLQLATTNRMQS